MSDFDRDLGFECDYCGQTVGGGIYDFEESLECKKREGWINRKIDGEWLSFCCEDCWNEYQEKYLGRKKPKKLTRK